MSRVLILGVAAAVVFGFDRRTHSGLFLFGVSGQVYENISAVKQLV